MNTTTRSRINRMQDRFIGRFSFLCEVINNLEIRVHPNLPPLFDHQFFALQRENRVRGIPATGCNTHCKAYPCSGKFHAVLCTHKGKNLSCGTTTAQILYPHPRVASTSSR